GSQRILQNGLRRSQQDGLDAAPHAALPRTIGPVKFARVRRARRRRPRRRRFPSGLIRFRLQQAVLLRQHAPLFDQLLLARRDLAFALLDDFFARRERLRALFVGDGLRGRHRAARQARRRGGRRDGRTRFGGNDGRVTVG